MCHFLNARSCVMVSACLFQKVLQQSHFNVFERPHMKPNIHRVESIARIVVGLATLGPQNLWFLLGTMPVIMGFVGWRQPYALLGINTCQKRGRAA